MKVTCGVDIIEVDRIKSDIENVGERFLKRVFTDKEIEYCESKNLQKYQSYAGRFAAKEAIFKAVSRFLDDKYSVGWKNFEVVNDKQGRPMINLLNVNISQIEDIDLSISHCDLYAVANVTILYKS